MILNEIGNIHGAISTDLMYRANKNAWYFRISKKELELIEELKKKTAFDI